MNITLSTSEEGLLQHIQRKHWTAERLAEIAVKRNIVDAVSRPTVSRILKKTTYRPIEAAIGSMPR